MSPDALSGISTVADKLTLVAFLLIGIVGFVVGWWITPGRFADAKAYGAEGWRQADELRKALVAVTGDMEKLIRAIEPLGPALKELARDHTDLLRDNQETKQCISTMSRRLEAIEAEWRMARKP